MHARVTIVSVQPDKIDESIGLYEATIEAARQQPGFVRAILVGDRSSGKSYSITVWESEEAERATAEGGFYQEQIAKFATVFAAQPELESMEVLFES